MNAMKRWSIILGICMAVMLPGVSAMCAELADYVFKNGKVYPSYDVEIGELAGTMMFVPPDQPKIRTFVSVAGGPHLVRYNSRLPIVIYAPEGSEVLYRLWSGERETRPVPTE